MSLGLEIIGTYISIFAFLAGSAIFFCTFYAIDFGLFRLLFSGLDVWLIGLTSAIGFVGALLNRALDPSDSFFFNSLGFKMVVS